MAVDAIQLVTDQLDPVHRARFSPPGVIERQVEAQIALQGWTAEGLSEQQAVYISTLATQALIPRLILKFSQAMKLKRAKGGSAEAEYQAAIDFLKALQEQLKAQVKLAAHEAAPEDEPGVQPPAYPMSGIVRIR